jgi:hypothetical protein
MEFLYVDIDGRCYVNVCYSENFLFVEVWTYRMLMLLSTLIFQHIAKTISIELAGQQGLVELVNQSHL